MRRFFTLIETIIVIAIIGVIASIVIPTVLEAKKANGNKTTKIEPTSKVISTSSDGDHIIATCEDGSIWSYSKTFKYWTQIKGPNNQIVKPEQY